MSSKRYGRTLATSFWADTGASTRRAGRVEEQHLLPPLGNGKALGCLVYLRYSPTWFDRKRPTATRKPPAPGVAFGPQLRRFGDTLWRLRSWCDGLVDARAIPAIHGVELLVTWNFRHIANAVAKPAGRVRLPSGWQRPSVLCTLEELLPVEGQDDD